MSKLIDIKKLSEELGPSVRTFRTLMHCGKIPYVRCGHRTIFFDAEKVRAALGKLEVKAVAT